MKRARYTEEQIIGILHEHDAGIRDVLAGRPTLLMSRELYAVPVLLGCIFFVLLLTYFPDYRFAGSIGCILLIFGLRAAAIHWKLTVPLWSTTKPTAK
jgi:uncharacterized membrane protein YeiH